MPSENAADVPTADQFILSPGNTACELASPTERKGIRKVAGDVVGGVEVGVAAALTRMDHIADETVASEGDPVGNQRNVVNGVGPGAVEVEL